jgi:hemerythrin-like domain-containing protein
MNEPTLNSTDNWLEHEHSLYEYLIASCQQAAETEDWGSVSQSFDELVTHLKQHMALEEEVLYPAYEASSEAPQGPTMALREEHDRIARLVRDIALLLRTRDSEQTLESLAFLENLLVKHHEKEEDIFLPMASHILRDQREELLRQLEAFDGSKTARKWEI